MNTRNKKNQNCTGIPNMETTTATEMMKFKADDNLTKTPQNISSIITMEDLSKMPIDFHDVSGSSDSASTETIQPSLQNLRLTEMGYSANCKYWLYDEQPPKPEICNLIKYTLRSLNDWNIKVIVGRIAFNCQFLVLRAYSKYFMNLGNVSQITLPTEFVTSESFYLIYLWMLSDDSTLGRKGIVDIFTAATFLRIESLLEQCWSCFDSTLLFNENLAFFLYYEVRRHDVPLLKELMMSRIGRFFMTLVASKEFLDFSSNELCELYKSNSVGVNSEIEVFMSAVRWLSYDIESRKHSIGKIMKSIRFNLMTPIYLRYLQMSPKTIVMNHIVNNSVVQELVAEAFIYTATEICIAESGKKGSSLFKTKNPRATPQRQWIFDKNCPYHHDFQCPQRHYFEYEEFLNYLEFLQTAGSKYWSSLPLAENLELPINCCENGGQSFVLQKPPL